MGLLYPYAWGETIHTAIQQRTHKMESKTYKPRQLI
jgi:hypothetical protein